MEVDAATEEKQSRARSSVAALVDLISLTCEEVEGNMRSLIVSLPACNMIRLGANHTDTHWRFIPR